ncbi:unnamed protein product [Psylliodes chrysocephalus]|uniref:Uncharacterized protein n=1 Tax=Psylliodes chrysocephalus TaxID=3402493 RepID=A0A9P0GJ36_9CUCU|nr:unnamed protein product [Psylliodes chrysocephala]
MDISEQNANEFSEAEKDLKVKIPKELKHILEINGYTLLSLIAEMTDEDVENVEKFSREVLPNLIELGQHKEYFEIFHAAPEKCTFLNGHKKLIFCLQKYYKELSKNMYSSTVELAVESVENKNDSQASTSFQVQVFLKTNLLN